MGLKKIQIPFQLQIQRYEGASTIYGPHTLTIYLRTFEKLMRAIVSNDTVDPGPWPTNNDGEFKFTFF
jgi:neutral ceramidase